MGIDDIANQPRSIPHKTTTTTIIMAASASAISSEQLQVLILEKLDAASSIPDTRAMALGEGSSAITVGPAHTEQMAVKGALESLWAKEMVNFTQQQIDSLVLTAEGETMAREGSHEFRVWTALDPIQETTAKTLQEKLGKELATVGQLNAFKKKWIKKQGDGFVRATETAPEDTVQTQLLQVQASGSLDDKKAAEELKKRKLTAVKKLIYYSVEKGSKYSRSIEKLETDLTAEMLQSGAWKTSSFKKYNFDAEGAQPVSGALHPLMKVREEFRNIFFEMGFTEMPTNQFVESSFWNFDTLFVPQQHPARDLQDTFFIKDPAEATEFPREYLEKVRGVHEGTSDAVQEFGSIGYRYPWKESETSKLVLRTHTTSVSAAMLYQIANQPGGFKPSKLFSIDRVFRNETVDATHLAEFHQVEGVVADENITLGDLIGFMEVFFKKMGIENLRFKPAYNPYTEPSLEIFSWHQGLGKWVEIGNSGMFRPEMLLPMGLPKNVRALGWGLSLERPTMIRYGISNIRDLLGHKVQIGSIEKSSAIRF